MSELKFIKPTFEEVYTKEWIVTNGIGGFASSTISGANSRRYHGLLTASLNPPVERRVLVSNIEETMVLSDGTSYEMSSNRYPGTIHPNGYQYITSFERLPFPTIHFQVERASFTKAVFMIQGSNTSIVEYFNSGNQPITLLLNPLFVDRDFHSLFHKTPEFNYRVKLDGGFLTIRSQQEAQPLYLKYSAGEFKKSHDWYLNFEYQKEQQRGLDYTEDACSIGGITATLKPGEDIHLLFTLDKKICLQDLNKLRQKEIQRINKIANSKKPDFYKDLVVAGDQFIVTRKSTGSYSIIAGYPWFADWGRDTMIAMRGLCIAMGKQDIAKSIFKTFFDYLDQGMLPNRFPDKGEDPEYNTVDATLWLFVALYEYYQKFKDSHYIQSIHKHLVDIIEWHTKGTRYGIHVTEEAFLQTGDDNVQLTWMDARIDDYVVTPRHGCPVEVNALWYNALEIVIFFSELLDKDCDKYRALASKLKQNFRRAFLNEHGYLNDVVIPGQEPDKRIRPNQIFAVSLPFSLLTPDEERSVVNIVDRVLYTPYGLRTLNPNDPDFKPAYEGDVWDRDTAYHQGTVWPFLLGDFFDAYLKVHISSYLARCEIKKRIEAIKKHFYEQDCILGISEIFDGMDPCKGRGTPQQAWSISALIKTMINLKTLEN